jgi:hypothetical protein
MATVVVTSASVLSNSDKLLVTGTVDGTSVSFVISDSTVSVAAVLAAFKSLGVQQARVNSLQASIAAIINVPQIV